MIIFSQWIFILILMLFCMLFRGPLPTRLGIPRKKIQSAIWLGWHNIADIVRMRDFMDPVEIFMST